MIHTYIECSKCGAINKTENNFCVKCGAVINKLDKETDKDNTSPKFEKPNMDDIQSNIPGLYLTEAGKIDTDLSDLWNAPEEEEPFKPEPDPFGLNGVLSKILKSKNNQLTNAVSLKMQHQQSFKKPVIFLFSAFFIVLISTVIFVINSYRNNNNTNYDIAATTKISSLDSEETNISIKTVNNKLTTVNESQVTHQTKDIGKSDIILNNIQVMNPYLFADLYGFEVEKADEENITGVGYLAVSLSIVNTKNMIVYFYPKAFTANTNTSSFIPTYYYYQDKYKTDLPNVTESDCYKVYQDETYDITLIYRIPYNEFSNWNNLKYDILSADWYDDNENDENLFVSYDIDIKSRITDEMVASLYAPPFYTSLKNRDLLAKLFTYNNLSMTINHTCSSNGTTNSINTSVFIKNRTDKTYTFPIDSFYIYMSLPNSDNELNKYTYKEVLVFNDNNQSDKVTDFFEIKPGETKNIWFYTRFKSSDEKPKKFVYYYNNTNDSNIYPYDVECVYEK